MPRIKMSSPWTPYFIRVADGVTIVLAGVLSLHIHHFLELSAGFPSNFGNYYKLVSATALIFSALPADLYRSWRGSQIPRMLAEVTSRWFGVATLLLAWFFLFEAFQDFSRLWFLVWVLIGLLLLWCERLSLYFFLRGLRRRGFNRRHVGLVGCGLVAESLKQRLVTAGWSGYKIVLTVPNADVAALENLADAKLDEVWLALPLNQEEVIKDALHALRHSTATIRFVPDLFTLRLINHGVTNVLGMLMYDLSSSPMSGVNQLVKWLEDKVLSSLILFLISPVMILLALGVKLTSHGPVFYSQERVGLNNKPFHMLKFRSMPVDTEKLGVQWGGSAAKTTTSFGQFIRKTSLDELPQFLNVLKGDMSIVGPRPERPMFVEQFKEEIPNYMKKHMVKAGITGWAQVHGWRGDTDLKTRIEYDLYYIENWSLWLDMKIIVMTVFKGFVNKNAY